MPRAQEAQERRGAGKHYAAGAGSAGAAHFGERQGPGSWRLWNSARWTWLQDG